MGLVPSRFGRLKEENLLPLPGFERWAVQFVASRCTDYAVRYHVYFMNVKFSGVESVCVCPLRVTLSNYRPFMEPRGASHDNSTGPY